MRDSTTVEALIATSTAAIQIHCLPCAPPQLLATSSRPGPNHSRPKCRELRSFRNTKAVIDLGVRCGRCFKMNARTILWG